MFIGNTNDDKETDKSIGAMNVLKAKESSKQINMHIALKKVMKACYLK